MVPISLITVISVGHIRTLLTCSMSSSSGTEEISDASVLQLIQAAYKARKSAYCPYSDFHVGAAVLSEDGTIVTGVNVENASYGLTVCAERVAVMNAISQGKRKFKALAVCCDVKGSFKASCGACRQVLAEFGLDWDLYLVRPDEEMSWTKMAFKDLLPMAFTPASLDEERV